MFEYQDEFLMNITTNAVGAEDTYYLCSANSTAEDQLAELARLVGSGGPTSKEKAEPITLVDSAPRLEFNLEEELSKAFASVPYSSPERIQPAAKTLSTGSTTVLQEEASEPASAPTPVAKAQSPAQPIQVHSIELISPEAAEEVSQSDLDLGDLISKEFEKALQEEANEPVSEGDAEFVDAIDKATDAFDAELARLMGSEQDSPIAAKMAPPIPEPTILLPDEPVIVEAPVMPTISEPDVLLTGTSEGIPAQMSDFEPPQIPLSIPEELVPVESGSAQEPASLAPESVQVPHIEPKVSPTSDVDTKPTVEHTVATPIVDSEIDLDDLKEPSPQFHDDQISIPEPHAAVVIGRNRKTGRRAAGSLIAVALLAGIGLAGWNAVGGGNKLVPTIMASTDPVKVKPTEAGGTVVPNQDQAVFRSVESSKKVEPKQKNLTDNSEKPIVVAKKIDARTEKSETRINRNEQSENSAVVVVPRKVRTVVVKPDGTILTRSSGITGDGQKLALNTASVKSKPVATKLKTDILAPNKVKLKKVKAETVAPVKKPEQAQKPAPAEKIAGVKKPTVAKKVTPKKPEPDKKVAAVKKPAPVKKAAVATKPSPAKKPEPAKKVAVAKKPAPAKKVASVKKPIPAKKTKPAEKKAESVKTTASVRSPYAVQVASQRSPEAAAQTYKVLARRYASVFRGKSMDIRKADIEGKGIYYRARIPAQTKASARKICQQLKAKGGDCFVTR